MSNESTRLDARPMDSDKDYFCVLSASPRDTKFITGRTVHTDSGDHHIVNVI